MKKKTNNDLILVEVGNKRNYFTTVTRAGRFVGLAGASVSWAIIHKNELFNNNDEPITFSIVDGSNIPYKYINND